MSEIDLEAALRAARERYAKASYQHHMAEAAHSLCGTPAADACTAMAKAAADAGSRLIALAKVVGAAETSCYRTFNSGLGPFEADGDDERLSAYCHIPGYRMCESCRAKAEAEMFAHFEGEP